MIRLAACALVCASCSAASPGADGALPTDAAAPDLAGPARDLAASPDAAGIDGAVAGVEWVYVGGYSAAIAAYHLDVGSGGLAAAGSTAFAGSPSFLALSPDRRFLFAANEQAMGGASAFSVDAASGALTHLSDVTMAGGGPTHVSVDASGAWLLAASYSSGHVAAFPIGADGRLGAAAQTPLAGMMAHEILADPSNRYALVPCLGADYIAQYAFDPQAPMPLAPNTTPTYATGPAPGQGAQWGPRHLAFHPTLPVVYLISETASTVSAHTLDGAGGQLSLLQAPISTLAMPVSGNTGAEVAVHPSGRFLYGSNRGDDSIALFSLDAAGKMTFVSTTPCGGKTPRHFSIDPTGRWLLVANQGSDSVTVFAIDPVAGGLTATPGAAVFPQPSFVAAFPPQ